MRPEFDNISDGIPATTVPEMAVSNRIVVGDKEYVAAFQGMAGLTFDFTDNMLIDVRYRYLQTGEFEYGAYVNDIFTELNSEYRAHEVVAGFRWNFGAPAPVIEERPEPVVQYKTCFDGSRVPVTADCPPEIEDDVDAVTEIAPLTVYFDYDKSNLTEAARTLISARADEAMDADVESITVQGNTDTSGSASYNQALSARRAAVVRDALISNGIDGSIISVEALGESNPAKATGDGVREPLNRRTEVTFNF
jgi:outer membrane protein OmpA-like peptidoglycan-associated protein